MGYNVTKIGLTKEILKEQIGHLYFDYQYKGDTEQTIISWIDLPHNWGLKIWVDVVIQLGGGTSPIAVNLRRNGVLQVQQTSAGVSGFLKEFRIVGSTGGSETWTLSMEGTDATTWGTLEGIAYCTFT